MQNANWKNLPLIIDGAHNPHAAVELSKERSSWNNQDLGIFWILGILQSKEAPSILRILIEPKDKVWIVPIPNQNSWSYSHLLEACPEFSEQLFYADEVEHAFKEIQLKNSWPVPPPVVAGSLYLIGDLLSKKIINV